MPIDNADQVSQTLNRGVERSIRKAGPSNQHMVCRCRNAFGDWSPKGPVSACPRQEDDALTIKQMNVPDLEASLFEGAPPWRPVGQAFANLSTS